MAVENLAIAGDDGRFRIVPAFQVVWRDPQDGVVKSVDWSNLGTTGGGVGAGYATSANQLALADLIGAMDSLAAADPGDAAVANLNSLLKRGLANQKILRDAFGVLNAAPWNGATTNPTLYSMIRAFTLAALNNTDPVLTSGITVTPLGAAMVRPNDSNAYAVGDLVANSTDPLAVVPFEFVVAHQNGGSGMVRKARLTKGSNITPNAKFRLHLFTVSPTVANLGDNGPFSNVSGSSNYVGAFDITTDRVLADGTVGTGAPVAASDVNFVCAPASTKLYGLLEAQGAYVPAAQEGFIPTLEVIQN